MAVCAPNLLMLAIQLKRNGVMVIGLADRFPSVVTSQAYGSIILGVLFHKKTEHFLMAGSTYQWIKGCDIRLMTVLTDKSLSITEHGMRVKRITRGLMREFTCLNICEREIGTSMLRMTITAGQGSPPHHPAVQ